MNNEDSDIFKRQNNMFDNLLHSDKVFAHKQCVPPNLKSKGLQL